MPSKGVTSIFRETKKMQDEHVMTVESYQDYEPVLPGGMPTIEAKLGARFSGRARQRYRMGSAGQPHAVPVLQEGNLRFSGTLSDRLISPQPSKFPHP